MLAPLVELDLRIVDLSRTSLRGTFVVDQQAARLRWSAPCARRAGIPRPAHGPRRTGAPGLGPYQLSKWAVEGFSEVLAKEVAPFGVQVTIVEPGGFRTDWAGDSMGIVENLHGAYEPTVGYMAARLRESSGSQPGDQKRAAKILVDIANDPDAPLHLLLGSDALAIARGVLEERSREDEKWAAVTESADFPK